MSSPFLIQGPGGSLAALNDPKHAHFVGYISEVEGLSGAEVREDTHDLTGTDGASHGAFYLGRRPLVLSGLIWPEPTSMQALRQDRLMRATTALREDGVLMWRELGQPEKMVRFRISSRPSIHYDRQRRFSLYLACADPRIYGMDEHLELGAATEQAPLHLHNLGSIEAPVEIIITGPINNPILVADDSLGHRVIRFNNLNIPAGQTLMIRPLMRTALLNGTVSAYGHIDLTETAWPMVAPGSSSWHLLGSGRTSATEVRVSWRDAWI